MNGDYIQVVNWRPDYVQDRSSVQINVFRSHDPEFNGQKVCAIQTILFDFHDELDAHDQHEVLLEAKPIPLSVALEEARAIAHTHELDLIVVKDDTTPIH